MHKWLSVRNLLAIAFLLFAGTLAIIVVLNYQASTVEEVVESLPEDVDLSLQKVSYTETRDGVARWSLTADSAGHSVSEGITRIKDVQMTFFNVGEAGDVVLTANQGEMNVDAKQVQLQGQVSVDSEQGYRFRTERLEYCDAEKLVRTAEPVKMNYRDMEVVGRGMQLNTEQSTVKLLSDVKARLIIPHSGQEPQ